MVRNPQFALKIPLAAALFTAAVLLSCGQKQTGPLSEGAENSPAAAAAKPAELPLDQQIDQKLDPLTKDDLDLYLKIMRAAAERVKNPQTADQAALEAARKILAAGASGRVPSQDDVRTLEHANQVALFMDQIVAEEMKVNGTKYRGIAEAVDSAILPPVGVKTSTEKGKPVEQQATTPLERRLSEVDAANSKFLAPYREELQNLIGIVRNPANLPK